MRDVHPPETGNVVQLFRDTKTGSYQITDERDIYELTANQGARRLRARILAILPPDIVEAALTECKQTLAGGNGEPIADRIRKMIRAFEKYGVTNAMIELRLGHSLDTVLPDEIADLQGIFNSLKNGMSKASDWFGGAKVERQTADNVLDGDPTDPPASAPAPKPATKKAKPAPEQQASAPAVEETTNETPTASDDGDIFG
jgi:hypothetical protein